MCGIVGEVSLSAARVDLERIRRRNLTIAHRGPDGAGDYIDPEQRCALAMRRLAIVDLAGGTQPMSNADKTVWVVFNGEIYNHVELRKQLEDLGHRFATDHSDTEVIVHGFKAWGEGMLGKLRGMFALAVWDERAARLLLARDRLGKKPVYYSIVNGMLVFGSELRTILEDERVAPHLDPTAIDQYLTFQFVPAPRTVVSGVRRLPAGHFLSIHKHSMQLLRFWSAPIVMDKVVNAQDALEELDRRLTESVRLRMRADVPVGVLLSGGLDSSIVTALAQREIAQPVHSFSVGFSEADLDESEIAAQVAAEIGTEHHPLLIDELGVDVFERVIDGLDEPLGDPAAMPTFLVSELARRTLKVVLTGEGGDETFAGYAVYRRENQLSWLLQVPQALRQTFFAALSPLEGASLRMQRIRAIATAGQADWHATFVTRIHQQARSRLYGRSLAQRVEVGGASLGELAPASEADGHEWHPIASAMRADLESRLPEGLLMKVDKMTMAHGVEARTPFLDHELVEWALRLPLHLKVDRSTGKILLKKIAERYLSAAVVHRPKHPFDVPVGKWLRGRLRGSMNDAFAVLVECGFSASGLRQLAADLDRGSERVEYSAWLLLVLGTWLIRHPGVRFSN